MWNGMDCTVGNYIGRTWANGLQCLKSSLHSAWEHEGWLKHHKLTANICNSHLSSYMWQIWVWWNIIINWSSIAQYIVNISSKKLRTICTEGFIIWQLQFMYVKTATITKRSFSLEVQKLSLLLPPIANSFEFYCQNACPQYFELTHTKHKYKPIWKVQ